MAGNKVRFTVEFDVNAWNSMTPTEQQTWIDDVTDNLNDEVYVSHIEIV